MTSAYVKVVFAELFRTPQMSVAEFIDPSTPFPDEATQRDAAALARWLLALIDLQLAQWNGERLIGGSRVQAAFHALSPERFERAWLGRLQAELHTDIGNALLLRDIQTIGEVRAFLSFQLTRAVATARPKEDDSKDDTPQAAAS